MPLRHFGSSNQDFTPLSRPIMSTMTGNNLQTTPAACSSYVSIKSGRHARKMVELRPTASGNPLPLNLHVGPIFLSRHEASGVFFIRPGKSCPARRLGGSLGAIWGKKNGLRVSEIDELRGNYSSKNSRPDKFEGIFLRKAEAGVRWFAAHLQHLPPSLTPSLPP